MFRILHLAGLVALLCLGVSPALAQTPLDYVRAGNYAAARALLAKEVKGRPDAPLHRVFLEGVILEQKGDLRAAASVFRQLLKIAPRFEPARLALAAVLSRMGNQRAALYQAEQLAATTPDARLRATLQKNIAAMGGGRRGGVALRFGLLPSSNANHATSQKTVLIGGVPFVLTPASREASGVGLTFGATAWHRWLLSEAWLATGQLSYDHWAYNRSVIPSQSLITARLDFNGAFRRTAVSFGPRFDSTLQDGSPYRNRVGLGASLSYSVTRKGTLGLSGDYYRQFYPTQAYLSGHRASLTPSYTQHFNKAWSLGFGLPLVWESTQRNYLDHRDTGVEVTLSHDSRAGLHLRLDLSYSTNRYGGIYPGMGRVRRDDVIIAGVTVSDDRIHLGKLVPEFSITRTVNASNISIQSYQSTDFGISLAAHL